MNFPEPLFETHVPKNRVCVVCGKCGADSSLVTPSGSCVIPICENCSKRWNSYGYEILKKIKFFDLIKNLMFFKLKNSNPSITQIFKDIISLQNWSKSVKKYYKNKKR